MIRYRLLYTAAVLTGIGLCIASGRGILLIPVVFLLCAGALSALFLLLAGRNVKITFQIRQQCVVGRTLPVTVQMLAQSPLPFGRTRVKLRFDNTLFGDSRGLELVLQPGPKNSNVFEMPYVPADCGRVKITVEEAVCYDLFGIVSKKIPKTPEMELIAYPVLLDFAVRKSARPRDSDASDRYDSFRRGQDVTEVFDVRNYREGDSLRSIHWKLSGKIGHPVVREWSDPTRYQTLLLYDGGAYRKEKDEADHALMNGVLSMTASLSKNLLEENLPHCVALFSGGETDALLVDSRNSFDRMLTSLMCKTISVSGAEQLAVLAETGGLRGFSKVVVVSGGIRQEILCRISEKVSVTAVELTHSGVHRVERQGNLETVQIPLEELERTVHAIEI